MPHTVRVAERPVWSIGTGWSYNNGLIQPFLNYIFGGGLYLTGAPIVAANRKAESSQRWTVPVVGRCSTSASCP